MKTKLFIVLCILAIACISLAWERTYGTGKAYSVISSDIDEYWVIGRGYGTFHDAYIICINSIGDTLWTRKFGGSNIQGVSGICRTASGDYIIAGADRNPGTYDGGIYIARISSTGVLLWQRSYNLLVGEDEKARSIVRAFDGGYIIVGLLYDPWPNRNLLIIKINDTGDTLWTRNYEIGQGWHVSQTNDSCYIITTGDRLVKTDIYGDTLWTRPYSVGGIDGISVIQTSDSGFAITGIDRWGICIYGGSGFLDAYWDNSICNIFLMKTNSAGDTQWTKSYGIPITRYSDAGMSLLQTSDNGYIVTGYCHADTADGNAFLLRTDSAGDSIWMKTYGDSLSQAGNDVLLTPDGGYLVVGFSGVYEGTGGTSNVYVLRTDSLGNSIPAGTPHERLAILVNTTHESRHYESLKRSYMACLNRGFEKDEIYVLHYEDTWDIDEDDTNDVNGLSNETNLEYAFQTWATSNADSSTKLYVFFTDHGGIDRYPMKNPSSLLTSTELDVLFDSYTTATGSDSIFFIYNACHSGSFIDELSLSARISMTSTNSPLSSWYWGGTYFPYLVFSKLTLGYTFAEAFNYTASVIEAVMGDGYQIPMLDDNGDGTGHTDPLPNGGDGALSQDVTWGIAGSKAILAAPEIALFTVDTSSSPDSIRLHVETSVAVDSCWVYTIRDDTTYTPLDTCGVDISCEGFVDLPYIVLSNTAGFNYDGGIAKAGMNGQFRFVAMAQAPPEVSEPIGDLSLAVDAGYIYELGLLDKLLPTEFDMFIEPNPFNTAVAINYSLDKDSDISLEIHDITGHKVVTLVSEHKNAGTHSAIWTAPNDAPSGIYFVRLKAGDQTITRRAILMKQKTV